jgi:hypothetical protein
VVACGAPGRRPTPPLITTEPCDSVGTTISGPDNIRPISPASWIRCPALAPESAAFRASLDVVRSVKPRIADAIGTDLTVSASRSSSSPARPSSPTLFNSGTRHTQMSSCFLVDSPRDELDSIYER